MNNENLQSNETIDYITNATEIKSNETECADTKRVWARNCPKCDDEIYYSGKRPKCAMKRAENKKSLCNKCAQIGLKHPNRDLSSFKRGKAHWNFGNNMPKESIEKMRKSLTGKTLPDYVVEKMIKSRSGKKRSDAIRERQRKAAIEAMRKRGFFRGYNARGCSYFDTLNEQRGWKLQHAKNGGEVEIIGYYPDAYDAEKNIIVEYDESHHYNRKGILRPKDVLRMNELIQKTNCSFYRYNEKTGELKLYNE
jgi:hypothetical protein